MRVQFQHISKSFGASPVLRDLSFEIQEGELFFLLGPSGCGKTTLLRLVAGFYQPDAGILLFGDRRMNGVEPHRRNTGMVFQNYALWPHLSVHDNVAYGLEVRRIPRPERDARVRHGLQTVRMEAFAQRLPSQLSGGQQQRVALARALVIQPDLLLLDEPLSNLDARLRLELRDEIRRIHRETRLTTLYVTHDQKEALSLADRLGVMRDGILEQIGAPRDLYRRPANRFVAEFMGEVNWIPGISRGPDPTTDSLIVETPYGTCPVPSPPVPCPEGAAIDLGFRPEAVRFHPDPAHLRSPGFRLAGVLEDTTYLGEVEQHTLRLPCGDRITACEQDPRTPRPPGTDTEWHLAASSVFAIPANPAATILSP